MEKTLLVCDYHDDDTPAVDQVVVIVGDLEEVRDVCAAHRKSLGVALLRTLAAKEPARPARAKKTARRRSKRAVAHADRAQVRAWAARNGHRVADRGKIPAEVLAAYQAATA